MGESQVLILGGGIAGMVAARELGQAGVAVQLLEARDRLGGRIYSVSTRPGGLPVELGAEFIHGEEQDTWPLVRAARLRTRRVPDRHWRSTSSGLHEDRRFWDEFGRVVERINPDAPDQDCLSFLDQAWGLSGRVKRLAREYIEGFHAAPANRMSIHALAKAEAAATQEKGDRNFHVVNGYGALVRWLAEQVAAYSCVEVCHNAVGTLVRWEPGAVEVEAQTPSGPELFHASRTVVTVPLGVLQQEHPAALGFQPALPAKERAIRSLAMGSAIKLTLHFSSRFWPVKNFGFLHSEHRWLPTWWSDERGLLLTGWAGGSRAQALAGTSGEELLQLGLGALADLFKIETERIRELLLGTYYHDWSADPFARGAYSFTPVGKMEMAARLAAPVAGTLFFAGEATDTHGDQGTVHGAIATGLRAARQILGVTSTYNSQPAELEMKR